MGDDFEITISKRVWMGMTEDAWESLEEFARASLSWRLRLLLAEEERYLCTHIAFDTTSEAVRLRISVQNLHKLGPQDYDSYTRDVAWFLSGALVRSLETVIGENAYTVYHLARTAILVNGHDWLPVL